MKKNELQKHHAKSKKSGVKLSVYIISFIKDKSKTKEAIILGLKSFENILPQFLCIIISVGILLSFYLQNSIEFF